MVNGLQFRLKFHNRNQNFEFRVHGEFRLQNKMLDGFNQGMDFEYHYDNEHLNCNSKKFEHKH